MWADWWRVLKKPRRIPGGCRRFQNKWLSVEFLDVTRPLAFLSMLVTLVPPPPPRHFTVVLKQSPCLRASHRKKTSHVFFGNSNLQHILPFFAGRLCEVTNYSAGVSSRKRGLFSGMGDTSLDYLEVKISLQSYVIEYLTYTTR